MKVFVDDRYKIHIYLDTNILVDYVEQRNKLLNQSLDYLSNSPFVILRSSHYVEFEFIEVRKRNEFYRCVTGNLPDAGTNLSFIKDWILNGVSYEVHKSIVAKKVEEDLEIIKEQLTIDFDDHVLHEKLIGPTKDICLSTKISREDSLVMVSCMYPKPSPSDLLEFGVILSNDKQYKEAFDNEKDTIESILNDNGIFIPSFLSLKHLQCEDGKIINLNVPNNQLDLMALWNHILKQLIIQKHLEDFIGWTITPPQRIENSVAIELHDSGLSLNDSDALICIPKDLSQFIIFNKDFNYWNTDNEIKELPFSNPKDIGYSFTPSITDAGVLNLIRQKGNLVFYYNI